MFRTSVGSQALYGRRILGACDCVQELDMGGPENVCRILLFLRPVNAYRSAMMLTTTDVNKKPSAPADSLFPFVDIFAENAPTSRGGRMFKKKQFPTTCCSK